MPVFTTSQGRSVPHCHLGQTPECQPADHSLAKIAQIRAWIKLHHPTAVETNEPTFRYNCIGFALAKSHGWFNKYECFYTDDYTEASFDNPALGDVVEYRKSSAFMHVAVVTRISNGRIVRVRSKWADGPELDHDLDDHLDYGTPAMLHRPRPGVMPLADLIDEEIPEPMVVVQFAATRGGEEMPEYESTEEAIQWALGRISDPDVYIRVNFASTPESARVLIEGLPGVKELIDIGPEAVPSVLNLLKRAQEQHETELSGIALYLLQRIPTEEAVQPLADYVTKSKFTGLNLRLAADALLTSAKVETSNENPITAALRAAEKIKLQE